MFKNKFFSLVVMAGSIASLIAVMPAFAQGMPNGRGFGSGTRSNGMKPGIFGTVSAISGTTLTVTQKMMRPNATTTPTTYTVDASNATITKSGATTTISSIADGDMVMVQGTISGTNVTATMVRDGVNGIGGKRSAPENPGNDFSRNGTTTRTTSSIQGNGEPVVGGNISSISGEIVTITNASNVSYTVDATTAKIVKNGATTTISALAIGDNIIAQGTVNGTSVTASSIIDQGTGAHASSTTPNATPSRSSFGFLGSIGNFFKHLFGF